MNQLYRILLILALFFGSRSGYCQTISLNGVSSPICAGKPVSLSITTDATFDSSNKLTLQTRSEYSWNQYTVIPHTQTGNVITFQFPGSLVINDNRSYAFRLISSAPALEGEWTSSVRVYAPAEVRLMGATPPVSNAFEPFSLQFEAVGSTPITATLSDSTRLTLNSYGELGFKNVLPFYTAASGTFQLVSVQNVCGLGKSSGQVALTVNPVALRTVSVSPAIVCRGSTVSVSYSKANGNFSASNRFKIRLTEAHRYSDVQPANPVTYTIDAKEENGALQAVIPDAAVGEQLQSNYFRVEVLATDPAVTGYFNKVYVELRPRASAEIATPSTTLAYGDFFYLNLKFQGLEPYQATLSDGTIITGKDGFPMGPLLKPKKTTTYRIERFQSACSTNEIPPTSMVVVVNPGVAIDSIPLHAAPFCEGQTMRIKFSTNATLGSDTRFSIVLTSQYNGWKSSAVTARRESENILAFEIPTLEVSTSSESRYYTLGLETTSPALRSISNHLQPIQINSKPTFARFRNDPSITTLESPNVVFLFVDTNGGGPYKLIANDGVRDEEMNWAGWSTITTTVFKTTTYTLRSVSNACGTLENPGTAQTVTVKSPTPAQIFLHPITEYRCETDSLAATFDIFGDFLPGNEFRVQVAESSLSSGYGWSDLKVVGRGEKSPVRFSVPNSSKIRIVSTNPVIVSNERPAQTGYRLRAVIPPVYYNDYQVVENKGVPFRSILPGETITLPIEVNSPQSTGPFSLTYTDGSRNYVYEGNSWNATQTVQNPRQTTTYRLVGVTNVCGPGQVAGEATFTVVPFRIRMPISLQYNDGQYYAHSVCAAGSLSIPFVTDVTPPTGTSFTLQIASRKDSVFTDLVTATASPLTARLPANLEPGFYWIRIVAKGTPVRTEAIGIKVEQAPGATLRAPATGTSISPGENFRSILSFTGSGPWQVLFSDNSGGTYYYSPVTVEFQPSKATTYTIKAVTNACGYGNVSGEVSVRVNPSLALERNFQSTITDDCAGGTVVLTYKALGDFEANNKLTIELTNSQGVALRTLATPTGTSGQVQLNLPTDVPTGNYQIRLRASNPGIVSNAAVHISLKTPPSIILTGSATINPGQSVYLSLRNEVSPNVSVSEQVSYRLSDGTTGRLTLMGTEPGGVLVSPTQTTTYTLSMVSAACGVGRARGSATITVNPRGERSINTEMVAKFRYCTGESVLVPFTTVGNFSATNRFQVQLLDSTGRLVNNLPSSTSTSPLNVSLPNDVPTGGGYRLRVVASDENTTSGVSPFPIQIFQRVTASFDSAVLVRQSGQPITLTIRFNGPGPYFYAINSDLGGGFSGSGTETPLRIVPPREGNLYTLVGVSNSLCGTGVVMAPASVRVDVLTAIEADWVVNVGPNPASDVVQVSLSAVPGPVVLRLTDINGRILQTKTVKTATAFLNLAAYPAGTYILSVEAKKRRSLYRLIRN